MHHRLSAPRPSAPPPDEEDDLFDYFYDWPGSEPGTLRIDPDALPSSLVLIDYDRERAACYQDIQPHDCTPYLQSPSVSWLDIRGLGSEGVLRALGDSCALHPLLLEDVVNVPQNPKVQDYTQHLLILMQMLTPNEDPDEVGFEREQVSFVLSDRYLLTFQEEPLQDCFEPVRQRIRNHQGQVRQLGSDYLTYLLVDATIDGYFVVLEDYGERMEALEEEVIEKPTRQTLQKIYALRRELLALRRLIWSQRNAIDLLIRDRHPLISEAVQLYFRDCYSHALQLLEIVETYRELAASLMDVYISAAGQKVNEIISLLTIVSSIFIPLTFIVGVYGMNFEYMPELGWRWGYFVCWGGMLAIASSLALFFWRRGWFALVSPHERP